MLLRWAIATAGALALALLTLNVPMPWALASRQPSASEEALGGGGAVCDAKAKPANLNFTLKDAANKDLTIGAYKGKVIVLDFWATWCEPCKLEIPGFIEMQATYASGVRSWGRSSRERRHHPPRPLLCRWIALAGFISARVRRLGCG